MDPAPSVRTLRLIALSFVSVIIGGSIAVFALRQGWDEPNADLAAVGAWVAGAVGVVGLVVAVRWRAGVVAAPIAAARLTTSFFITIALAEAGMLIGLVFSVLTQSVAPFVLGTAVFCVSLAVILISFSQVEVESDGSPKGLMR